MMWMSAWTGRTIITLINDNGERTEEMKDEAAAASDGCGSFSYTKYAPLPASITVLK